MNSAASVGRSEHLRLFFGLPIPPDAGVALVRWQADVFLGAPGIRMVPPEHLHITLAFLGSRPAGELAPLGGALHEAATGIERPVLTVVRYRETERVAMLVLDDEDGRAGLLQARLSERLQRLGAYRPERRPWLAHLTVARVWRRPGLRPALPELGPVSPSEASLYHSVLRPSGAQYDIVESVALGG